MATAQMSNYALIPTYVRSMPEVPAAVWKGILAGVSTTQLGLDFAFDIFVSLGTALLGIQVARHPRIPTLLGAAGTLIAGFGFAMNVIAFPANAGDVGLIDPAPYFGVWLGVTAIPVLALRRWQAPPGSDEPGGSVGTRQRET
jgi:hypothetical protein